MGIDYENVCILCGKGFNVPGRYRTHICEHQQAGEQPDFRQLEK